MLDGLLDIGDSIRKGTREYVVLGYNKDKILEVLSKNFYIDKARILYNYGLNLTVKRFLTHMLEREVYYYERIDEKIGEIGKGYSYPCCDWVYEEMYSKEWIKKEVLKLTLLGKFSVHVVSLQELKEKVEEYVEKNYNQDTINRIIDTERNLYKDLRGISSVKKDILIQSLRRNSIIQTYDTKYYYYYQITYNGTILYLKKGLRGDKEEDFKDYINMSNGHLNGTHSIKIEKEDIKGTKGFLVKIL